MNAAIKLVLLLGALCLSACGSTSPPQPLPTVGEIYQLVLDSPGHDTDGDGIPDDVELHPRLGTDPDKADSDSDGVFDAFEVFGRSFLFVVTDGEAGELHEDDLILVGANDPAETGEASMVDSDGDGVYNYLEYYGYTYDWPTGRFVRWTPADRQAHPEVPWYRTDPLQPSTDQDAYSDGMEVSGVRMDVAVAGPGRHPLVPAYPDIVVRLTGYTVTLNEDISYSKGGSLAKEQSWSRETQTQHGVSRNSNWEVGIEGGFEGGIVVRPHVNHGWGQETSNTTSTQTAVGSTVNEEINWNMARSYNPTEAARIKLFLKVENHGSAPASNIIPTINLRVGGSNVANFEQEDFQIQMLMPGAVYPEGEGIYWVVDSTASGPLSLTQAELKALENGAPINISVTQVKADVMRLGEDGSWQAMGDMNEFVARCQAVSANLFADLGDGRFLHRLVYAGEGVTAPPVTLRDGLGWTMNCTEKNGDTFIEHEARNGEVEKVKVTNDAGEGWSFHMDKRSFDTMQPGDQPLDLKLTAGSHVELIPPRAGEDPTPLIYSAYAVPMDEGYDVVVCATDYEGIKEVAFIDKTGAETVMKADGRGPWFYSARVGKGYDFNGAGAETVRVTSMDDTITAARRPVELIHTIVSEPPLISRMVYDMENNRLEVKVEPGGERAEDALVWPVRLYHPSFLAAETKEERDGYITMRKTVYWFEEPDVYEADLPHGWMRDMRVVAATAGGLYSAADVKSVATIRPYGYGHGVMETKIIYKATFYLSHVPDHWNVPQLTLDLQHGWWAESKVRERFGLYDSWSGTTKAWLYAGGGWPADAHQRLLDNFAKGTIYIRANGAYWPSYLFGIQTQGVRADPTASGKSARTYYLELTKEDVAILSSSFEIGPEYPLDKNEVFVFKTRDGRLGKLLVTNLTLRREGLTVWPMWHDGSMEFSWVTFRKDGDGEPPAYFKYEEPDAHYSVGAEVPLNRPVVNYGDPADSFAVAPALPAGLSLDPLTGIISGTPTVAATPGATYTVTATNTNGDTATTITIEVLESPSGLSYTTPVTCPTHTALPINTPTLTSGHVDEYTISPALPTGVTIDPDTGVISGTPTEATDETEYTVTASNDAGASTTAVVKLATPLAAPRDLTYPVTSASYPTDASIVPLAPTVIGEVVEYTIAPALPAGMAIHPQSGVISGKPTVVTAATIYTVTASNAAGTDTAAVTLTTYDPTP